MAAEVAVSVQAGDAMAEAGTHRKPWRASEQQGRFGAAFATLNAAAVTAHRFSVTSRLTDGLVRERDPDLSAVLLPGRQEDVVRIGA